MVSARQWRRRLLTGSESSATVADGETHFNYQRTCAARDQDGRARVAGRLQLPMESAAPALPERARSRARTARDSHPQRAANRRELDAAPWRVHEAHPDALDSQRPAPGRGARRAPRDPVERSTDELRDYLRADSQRDRQAPRSDIQELRS